MANTVKFGPQRIAHAVDGGLAFFHRFEQRGLRARRGAIDFVHQQQIGEDRPAMQRKRTGGQIENVRSNDVGRHQVRRALDALKSQPANSRQRFDRERFRQSRDAFQQCVTAADQHDQKLIDDFLLPDDYLRKFGANVSGEA